MKRKKVLVALALAMQTAMPQVLMAALPALPGESTKPNVVYILVDDQRYDAFGFLNPSLRTPHMDSIAREGTYFKNAFVTTSLCSPSRASILTGMYAHHHGVSDNNPMDLSHLSYFPELLRDQGYQTGFFGKWHFGGADQTATKGFAGFDRWVGLLGQGNYYPVGNFGEPEKLNVDGKLVPQKGYITDELTDYAVDWLNHLDKSKPFMMYLSHKGVHSEFHPAKRHRGSMKDIQFPRPDTYADTEENYAGKPMWVKNQRNSWHGVDYPYNSNLEIEQYQRDYYETLRAVDDSVGRVREWLKQNGLDKNTIIMVMGDNGFMFGEHGLIDKRNAYEESIRVPLIAAGPGFAKNKVDEGIVRNIDVAPTILEAAGIEIPQHYDGQSFLKLDSDRAAKRPDSFVYEYFWEYSFPQTPTTFAIRTAQYKYIQYYGIWDKEELYDMQRDPQEKHNLIDSKEDAIIQTKVALRKQLYDGLRTNQGKNVIPYNQRVSPGMVYRYEGTGEQLATFPREWLKGYDHEDILTGFFPDQVGKESKVKAADEARRKGKKILEDLLK
ncbi:sulfatase [Methylobacillus gramineus]|uniref:sulfatase family protein n=1 Tax=Methylobacillus gramineus TaxID=755169 RepID=UPI001CFF9165|nr:sulfatase [Methylobacillus gramineus]MCB5186091.1 sulfatase [Methylobacillus gramineus]